MDALSEAEKRAEKLNDLKRELDNRDRKLVELERQLSSQQASAHVSNSSGSGAS